MQEVISSHQILYLTLVFAITRQIATPNALVPRVDTRYHYQPGWCGFAWFHHRCPSNGATTGTQWIPLNNDKDTHMKPLAFLEGQGFHPDKDFNGWRAQNGYKSLRDFMDRAKYTVTPGADQTCGWSDPKGTPQPIPKGGVMRSTGYTHDGPCAVYLDDVLVMEYDNCHEKITGKDYPIDFSSCEKNGSCTLYWFWLGVRFVKNRGSWQVYKECIPVTAGGANGGAVQPKPRHQNKNEWWKQKNNGWEKQMEQQKHLRM
ncbi:unnamed protein product [Phytophthora lilii]|uniref:Unnamed protein product n=1 Tax=Phytophthora lilii TaxID=2077276 RepID=A0A9W6TIG7_9STRA|nr:unnamed protein product [Phytophthora lilii]